MNKCPKCGSPNVRESQAHSWIDALRHHVTGKVPYRCRVCRRRWWDARWLMRYHSAADIQSAKSGSVTAEDLDELER